MTLPLAELPAEPVICTFRGGSQHGLEITVDLHRVFTHEHKSTGEFYYRVAEAPDGKLRFYFDLAQRPWKNLQ